MRYNAKKGDLKMNYEKRLQTYFENAGYDYPDDYFNELHFKEYKVFYNEMMEFGYGVEDTEQWIYSMSVCKKVFSFREFMIARPILNTVNINSRNELEIYNGFTGYQLKSKEIAGLPYTPDNMTYVNLDGMFVDGRDLIIIEHYIDIELLNKKLALYKANKKKVNAGNCYQIGYKCFNPEFIKECIDLLGVDFKIYSTNDLASSPIYAVSDLGRGIILPIRISE
jgi:hypothetical protein